MIRMRCPFAGIIENGRAVGVAYAHRGREIRVRAEQEVLLSGGAINSPQLLMLSGVGPADHLRERGITPQTWDREAAGIQLKR